MKIVFMFLVIIGAVLCRPKPYHDHAAHHDRVVHGQPGSLGDRGQAPVGNVYPPQGQDHGQHPIGNVGGRDPGQHPVGNVGGRDHGQHPVGNVGGNYWGQGVANHNVRGEPGRYPY